MTIETKIAQIVATGWLINSSNRIEAIEILKGQIAELLELQAKNLHKPLVSGSLPTDAEIEKWAFDKYHEVEDSRWYRPLIEGAKWMRSKVVGSDR